MFTLSSPNGKYIPSSVTICNVEIKTSASETFYLTPDQELFDQTKQFEYDHPQAEHSN